MLISQNHLYVRSIKINHKSMPKADILQCAPAVVLPKHRIVAMEPSVRSRPPPFPQHQLNSQGPCGVCTQSGESNTLTETEQITTPPPAAQPPSLYVIIKHLEKE